MEKPPSMFEKLLIAPLSLTVIQRKNTRYKMKKSAESKMNFLEMIMNSKDEKLKKFVMEGLSKRFGVGNTQPQDYNDKNENDHEFEETDPETESFEDSFWNGKMDL